MNNFFAEKSKNQYIFSWNKLGNISEGRRHLGEDMPVMVYRMLAYSMKHVLHKEVGIDKTCELFREAGYTSGKEYAINNLPLNSDYGEFMAEFIKAMEDLKIGIVRVEYENFEEGEFIITVYEDIDCSGLPPSDEVVCNFDEGFLSGVLEVYLKKPVKVREIDCWSSGDRVCRFKGIIENEHK